MKNIKNPSLIKLFLVLINFLLVLNIIEKCKITEFCFTILSLISPIFFGFAIAWTIKPIMLFFNKKFSVEFSSCFTFILLGIMIFLIGYFVIPVILKEFSNLIPNLISIYNKISNRFIDGVNITDIINRVLKFINSFTGNIKSFFLNLFYSLFMSFFFLTNHLKISNYIAKFVPRKLVLSISKDLRIFIKGTLIDTLVLFIMSLIAFLIVGMPYSFLIAIFISIFNIIPFIGPYIGAIPAIIIAFASGVKFTIIIIIIIVLLQFIESSFIHPYIMSKSLKISPIIILIGLIVFGYFFGIVGMLLSTPIICIIRELNKYFNFRKVLHKWFCQNYD